MPNPSRWIRPADDARKGAGSACDGSRLGSLLARERALGGPPWPTDAAVSLLDPVAAALARLHAGGHAHLEIEPDAIAVVRAPEGLGDAELLDPGGAASPTLRLYRAPEQRCEAYGIPGPWTDVFALALVFVEIVSGAPPGEALEPEALVAAALESLRLACAPVPVQGVAARALSVYPAERYQTAASFWRALSLESTRAPAASGGTPIAARS